MNEAKDFWDEKGNEERLEIMKEITAQNEITGVRFPIDLAYDELSKQQQDLLKKYYEETIVPQLGKQQIKYDSIIEEKLPSELSCPRCSAPAIQCTTKRGFHWKCQNIDCGWDSNRPFDFSRESRDNHILRCMNILKEMFPAFNFVKNFSYSPDAVLTGIFEKGIINYDVGIFFMGTKYQRLRIELNQHISQEQFMNTDHDIYVIGRKKIVEYLASRDGLVVHFLVDEPKRPIGMSRLKIIKENCPQKEDKFGNIQYTIPKNIRPLITTFDVKEMQMLLTREFYVKYMRNITMR
jgi:hypothetical protein